MRILVVEDEVKVAEVLKRGLSEADYEVDIAYDGQLGLRMAMSGNYELVILDINLPVLNGLELCKRLREHDETTPVLMLTALGMSDDIVTGLEAGADDYLAKPFRFNELYARIKALTRRKRHVLKLQTTKSDNDQRDSFRLADLEIDFDAREVKRAGKLIQLTAREYALLEYLARNTGKVRSRLEIAKSVWGLDFETGTNFIDVYVNYLRNKIDKPFDKKLVQTITGFGYVFKTSSTLKIRQSLALLFTFVFALLTGAILIFIYILTRGFVNADFVERLTQQASLEALHFATPHVKDVMPSGSFNLVNPEASIYSVDGTLVYKHGSFQIPKTWIEFLRHNTIFNAERGEYTTVGRRHDIDGKRYLVFVSDKDLPGQHELDILVKAIIVGWLVSLMLSYLAGLYFSGNALQPVQRVVKEVNQITHDNLGYRLTLNKELGKVDEIDELILTFNALLTRIESAFKAQQRFVQNASHELKTPLTAIMAEAELALAKDRPVEEYKRTLEVVVLETERLVTITQGLLTLARLEEGSYRSEMDNINILTLLNDTLTTFKLHYPDRNVITEGDLPTVYLNGNAQLLQIALLNMLDNAVKYSSDKIMVNLDLLQNELTIGIQDFGIGIPMGEMARIRSPLFRASNVRDIPGSGLGLSLVERIISIHNGSLDIRSQEGKGTLCMIKLPVERIFG